ncbi:hypothetical protein D9757_011696 [Collybiopsis confluens]|uniref:Uncharacterized protein n=1 Tax=Collybiopsis confluens TaxID=2823264 RepID=A0A8H5GMA8_9AGAR|nr:hypothetical protein D9757_011696 [Collybiopsis confluens]
MIITVSVITFGYQYFASFYRASAREVKRLDAILRSLLYSHFSESLTGLPTIRSYGEIPQFVRDNRFYIDLGIIPHRYESEVSTVNTWEEIEHNELKIPGP